jgi:type I restriction enzyme M protein
VSNLQEISSLVWEICDDDLRGLFKSHEYGDVILPFLVLRRLDLVLEPTKEDTIRLWDEWNTKVDDPSPIIMNQIGSPFFNHSLYDLRRLTQDPSNLLMNLNLYLDSYSQNVQELIYHFSLQRPIERLQKNGKLFNFLQKFSEINLGPEVVDNHVMGQVFEELLRKFSEMSNETSGEHYTPRDVVSLLVSLIFSPDKDSLQGSGLIRSVFDPCCGTGGMLSVSKNWIHNEVNPDITLRMSGQEFNPQTYSICKGDFLITGEDPEQIRLGSSLSEDKFPRDRFDYMITNPPYGVSWKSEQGFIEEESKNPQGRFSVGTPRSSDGQLLFLQHMISKMDPDRGSRIGVVFNGSPLFTGDSGGGESEIRRWILENDWLEGIIRLPDQLYFNTGITTYLWLVTNRKPDHRKGKVQLIDGSGLGVTMRKSLGSKRKEIPEEMRNRIVREYLNFEKSDISKVFPNEFFGYTKVCVEQPLIENGKVKRGKDGSPKPDTSKRDYERIPMSEDIGEYLDREVRPHLKEFWIDESKTSVGYEINFSRYFYEYTPPRSTKEILDDILSLERESDGLLKQLMEGMR